MQIIKPEIINLSLIIKIKPFLSKTYSTPTKVEIKQYSQDIYKKILSDSPEAGKSAPVKRKIKHTREMIAVPE